MKYVVITHQEDGKKTVFLETNFFKGIAVFPCVKVEIKDIPNNLARLPDAELQERLWRNENYAEGGGVERGILLSGFGGS